jgi:hypothetical protein
MQERDNISHQSTPDVLDITPTTTALATNVDTCGCGNQIGNLLEEERERERKINMSPDSQQLLRNISHADSFFSASSLDSSASGLLTSVMKGRVGGLNKPATQSSYPQQDVGATATLAAQALQNPALSESALLLFRLLRETANLERAPTSRSIMEQHEAAMRRGGTAQEYGTLSPIPPTVPQMNHEEKVKVLRRLYASRTRNKVSNNDANEKREPVKGQETTDSIKAPSNKRKSSSLDGDGCDPGHRTKRIKFAVSVTALSAPSKSSACTTCSTKRTFVSRCA